MVTLAIRLRAGKSRGAGTFKGGNGAMERTVSYAQNGEDIVLNRVFRGKTDGFYVDVGANDPVADSVTMLFYQRGWRGVNVEPAPGVYERLAGQRVRDINLNVGLSDREGMLTFHDVASNQGLSTLDDGLAARYRAEGMTLVERVIPVTTLARVCEREVGDRPVDFMKIDVEGHECEVLAGADWDRWRPRVLIVESTSPERWDTAMEAAGYHLCHFDGINYYLVRDEDRAWLPVLSVPVNVTDIYSPYMYLRMVEEARSVAEGLGPLGPTTLRLIRRLQAVSRRNPRMAATAKKVLRWLRVA